MHPAKKVVFSGLDSEEEGKRSVRGVEFRRWLKETGQQEKMAARDQRAQNNIDQAGRTFQCLMLGANRIGLGNLARNEDNGFFDSFSIFYRNLLALNLGRGIQPGSNAVSMLRSIERKRPTITFQQIQQERRLLANLVSIGANVDFSEEYLIRREGHVSSADEAEVQPGVAVMQPGVAVVQPAAAVAPPAGAGGVNRRPRPRQDDGNQDAGRRLRPRH